MSEAKRKLRARLYAWHVRYGKWSKEELQRREDEKKAMKIACRWETASAEEKAFCLKVIIG